LISLPLTGQVKKMQRWLADGEFDKASDFLQKQEVRAYDNPPFVFSQVLYLLHSGQPERDVETAYQQLGVLHSLLMQAEPKDLNRWAKEDLTVNRTLKLMRECELEGYNEAMGKNSEVGWQYFLSTFDEYSNPRRIERLRDSLGYWEANAEATLPAFVHYLRMPRHAPWRQWAEYYQDTLTFLENTADSSWRKIEAYLEANKDSRHYNEAKRLMEWLRYRDETSDNTFEAYDLFARLYPASYYFEEAKAQREYHQFQQYQGRGTGVQRFLDYVKDQPNSYYRPMAEDSIYRLITHPPTLAGYQTFLADSKFADSPHRPEAWRGLYRLFTADGQLETFDSFAAAYPDFPFQEMLRIDRTRATNKDLAILGVQNADLIVLPEGDSVPLAVIRNLNPRAAVSRGDTNGNRVRFNLGGVYNPETREPVELLPQQNLFVEEDGNALPCKVIKVGQDNVLPVDMVFTIDVSGSMDDEQDQVRRGVVDFAQELESKGLNVRFGLVTYEGDLKGSLDFGTAQELSDYLNGYRSSYRNRSPMEILARNAGKTKGENGMFAIAFAHHHFNYRDDAQKVFVNFTDEPNQIEGAYHYTTQLACQLTDISVHTVWSGGHFNDWSRIYERPWEMSDCSNGVAMEVRSDASDLNLRELPIVQVMTSSVLVECASRNPNQSHTVTITVQDINADGTVTYENLIYEK